MAECKEILPWSLHPDQLRFLLTSTACHLIAQRKQFLYFRIRCWAHARRKFDEALTAVPKDQQPASKPAEALCYFAKLFQMEQDFAALTSRRPICQASGAGKTCSGGSVGMGK